MIDYPNGSLKRGERSPTLSGAYYEIPCGVITTLLAPLWWIYHTPLGGILVMQTSIIASVYAVIRLL